MIRLHPLLAAGYRWCEACQMFSFPVDAAYLGPSETGLLVMAEYFGCEHGTGTVIVDTAEIQPDQRCTAATANGRRCRNATIEAGRCRVHASAIRNVARKLLQEP
jgi:hypothetical protein